MTTIVSVRKGDRVAIGGDGQVSFSNTVLKASARKVRANLQIEIKIYKFQIKILGNSYFYLNFLMPNFCLMTLSSLNLSKYL